MQFRLFFFSLINISLFQYLVSCDIVNTANTNTNNPSENIPQDCKIANEFIPYETGTPSNCCKINHLAYIFTCDPTSEYITDLVLSVMDYTDLVKYEEPITITKNLFDLPELQILELLSQSVESFDETFNLNSPLEELELKDNSLLKVKLVKFVNSPIQCNILNTTIECYQPGACTVPPANIGRECTQTEIEEILGKSIIDDSSATTSTTSTASTVSSSSSSSSKSTSSSSPEKENSSKPLRYKIAIAIGIICLIIVIILVIFIRRKGNNRSKDLSGFINMEIYENRSFDNKKQFSYNNDGLPSYSEIENSTNFHSNIPLSGKN
ncbi:hypothetical protein BCR32DRAFT_240809 [Anaeromyces robustus]|uniref:Mid2 domain-containing protein n=1 Tax=Anaeromyces robustus TaxID=1754192 RepID=A0A1Y1XLU2_9FUNG|nr:hypothetical protein BCR32DRAFT_240809 [Anaeromyces robustus]|eukprot:ORX86665.1 hypothetical protein BCR32DRAFT_240809 [Anaeromyces robustus]